MSGLNDISFSSHISSKSDQFLYCSEVTARLLKNMIKGNESVVNKIKPLGLGPNWLQVPIKDSDYLIDVVVTLLPAGHCLGSCM
jgi:Cft2 family RNA processing exonuclease